MNSILRLGTRPGLAVLLASCLVSATPGWGAEAKFSTAAAAPPFVHPLFADNLVVQRNRRIPVWGWAEPGQKVTVRLHNKKATVRTDARGKWLARLGSFKAGGPFVLTISGPQTVTLTNVLVGDVWICSGQSDSSPCPSTSLRCPRRP
jgi:hypothetical protein